MVPTPNSCMLPGFKFQFHNCISSYIVDICKGKPKRFDSNFPSPSERTSGPCNSVQRAATGASPVPTRIPEPDRDATGFQLPSNKYADYQASTEPSRTIRQPPYGDWHRRRQRFRRPCRPRLGVRRQPARGDATPAGLRARTTTTTGAAMPRRWWWPRWSRRSRTSPCRRGGSS